ncbi:hypothetical protein IV203_035505 [Nitzschia inconspicua]|uniref:COP9 signalosome complex subunit 8 n=1 Tax=Nitzschia inconspicua TaxID=303405 RepID=A0A9K3LGE2_9STRA|nr:hypothetical protein IV203_035505 [Nitzschia inconspicua]
MSSWSASWPPPTLMLDTASIINECELMELSPGRGQDRQFVTVVEMAALLYQGDTTNARHLWRRCAGDGVTMTQPLLEDWWKVGRAMIEWNAQDLWTALKHISASHPTPIQQYATEVATSFRKRLFTMGYPVTSLPMAPLLNFASPTELNDFCQQYGYIVMENGMVRKTKDQDDALSSHLMTSGVVDPQASIVQVVTFLESSIAYQPSSLGT